MLFKSFIATFAYIGLSNKSQSADVTQIPANKEQNNLRPPVSVDNSNFQIVSALSKPTGLALIGQCESINELRTIIPENHGQRISVKVIIPLLMKAEVCFTMTRMIKPAKIMTEL